MATTGQSHHHVTVDDAAGTSDVRGPTGPGHDGHRHDVDSYDGHLHDEAGGPYYGPTDGVHRRNPDIGHSH